MNLRTYLREILCILNYAKWYSFPHMEREQKEKHKTFLLVHFQKQREMSLPARMNFCYLLQYKV